MLPNLTLLRLVKSSKLTECHWACLFGILEAYDKYSFSLSESLAVKGFLRVRLLSLLLYSFSKCNQNLSGKLSHNINGQFLFHKNGCLKIGLQDCHNLAML